MAASTYDLRYRSDHGGLHLQALTKNGKKEVKKLNIPFKPYCYIKVEDLNPNEINRQNLTGSIDEAPPGYAKIKANHPSDIRDFRESAAFEVFEADVPYVRRVLIDTDQGLDLPEPEDCLFFDIEVDPRGEFPEPDDADAQVLSIAAVGGDGKEKFFIDDDEKQMLKDFFDYADDYFILVGYNSMRFDWPYLKNRAKKLGVPFRTDRWVHLDMYPLYRSLTWTTSKSFRLDDIAQNELGVPKSYDVENEFGMEILWDWFKERDPRLEEYNMQDARILKDLDEKLSLIEETYQICRLCHTLPRTICYLDRNEMPHFAGGQACDAKILEKANKRGHPLPCRGKYADTHEFPGGHVFHPEAGLYENVVTIDFSGMYPNIIRAFNFGPNTWFKSEDHLRAEHPDIADEHIIQGESGVFLHPDVERSVLAEAVDELIEMRYDFKAKKKAATPGTDEEAKWTILDAGMKAIVNTLYGVFASPYHRYYHPGMSENITLLGQALLKQTQKLADMNEHPDIKKVVYGDTDSVMLQLDADDRDTVEVAKTVAKDINDALVSWAIEERNAVGEYLDLDLDDVYSRFYIGDKKKRYFGHIVYTNNQTASEFKIKGFEQRRSNWPECARDFQKQMMEAVIFDKPTRPIIEDAKHKLFTGQWDLEMTARTSLTKPLDQYDTKLPHTRAAEKIMEDFGAEEVRVGDKIPHIKYGDQKTDVTHAYNDKIAEDFRPNEGYCTECDDVFNKSKHEHEVEDYPNFRRRHYTYFFDKYFKSSMNRVGVSETNQMGLEEFA